MDAKYSTVMMKPIDNVTVALTESGLHFNI
ncbi:hypothetical protein ACVLD2_000247 [Paenibacillus sp. PvR052]|nr:hypothetical protein [Paenibacillus sp. PvP091]MBP1168782.1 hypothetical protein [Paenibacillus sp. PvR098]MBP2439810.1 hypothetical protein [Paenibacillus sp. PvP052]